MTEFWKSQAKKFCDFCKCWISDNKPSVSFHESGKRHKENVTKRLSEIRKNSAKSHREELQIDKDMKKMEEEALKAYMNDLKENPDFTSQRILEETEKKKKELEELVKRQLEGNEEPGCVTPTEAETVTNKVWYEAKSDEDYTYYWNINTSESRWEPPEEGFVSLEEQDKQSKEDKVKEEIKRRKKEEKAKQKEEHMKAFKEKKSTKQKRKKSEDEDETASLAVGPAPKPDPYGVWTVVEPVVEEPLDLELPQQEYVAIKVPDFVEPQIKFKEKTVASLQEDEFGFGTMKKEANESCGNFKKRKLNRGNMRQKLDTD